MTTRLKQINVTYVEVEDRLLLKVSTTAEEEFRLWCTRRFTRLLLERLEASFEQDMTPPETEREREAPAVIPQQARREVAQMQHQQTVSEEAFDKPYEAEPASYPLGEEGVLVTTLKYKPLPDGGVALHLGDQAGRGMNFNLNTHLKHQTYELLLRAAQRAEWLEPVTAPATGAALH